MGSFHREETEKLCVYLVGNLAEVLWVLLEVKVVTIDDDELALVVLDPFFVAIVESLKVVDADALLEVSASALYVAHEGRDAASDVDHEVGQLHQTDHQVEEVGVVGEVTVAHHANLMQVGSENLGILKDGTVLDDILLTLGNLYHVVETLVEEIDLEIE